MSTQKNIDQPVLDSPDVIGMLMQLNGTSSLILLILLSLKRPVDVTEFVEITDFALSTLNKGLNRLRYMGLIDMMDEENTWVTTAKAEVLRQVLAPESVDVEKGQPKVITYPMGEKFFSSPCSRRGSIISSSTKKSKKLPQPQPKPPPVKQRPKRKVVDALPNDIKIQQAFLILVRTGVPDYKAVDAILAATKAGWEGVKILDTIQGWLKYAATERGETIKHPGFFAADRLSSHQLPPEEDFEEGDDNPYLDGKYGHLIKH